MGYKKAEEILPEEVLTLVQQYVDGESIYIPRKAENRREWGDGTGYRAELQERNRLICLEHGRGMSVTELSRRHHLSEKSIRRILQHTQDT